MSESGWPLIPRELLPAPVERVRHPRPAADAGRPPGRQLPIFGAETTEPSPGDLAGLLAGPGRLERMGGTARVTVPVDAGWRVHVLSKELVRCGLVVSWLRVNPEPAGEAAPGPAPAARRAGGSGDAEVAEGAGTSGDTEESGDPGEFIAKRDDWRVPPPIFELRTAYSSRLNALARSRPAAADRLFLSGPRLRLWVAAGGYRTERGFALGLTNDRAAEVVVAALVGAGLAGDVSDDGRSYLISDARRLARLAELVGERPAEAPPGAWPGDVAA